MRERRRARRHTPQTPVPSPVDGPVCDVLTSDASRTRCPRTAAAGGRPRHSGRCSGPPKSGLVKSGLEKLGRGPAAGPLSGLLKPGRS